MDSATAGLLGAAIGGAASLLGSAVAPWLRDLSDRRYARKRTQALLARDALAIMLTAATASTQNVEQIRDATMREAALLMEIRLLERKGSRDVSNALMYGLTIVRMDPARIARMATVVAEVIPLWHAGKMTGEAVLEAVYAEFPPQEVLTPEQLAEVFGNSPE
ncbi:hypothetical protein SAMN05660766_2249 [Curtobacterium sp. 314Chir4.1]|uniref:hypothetical protein n=1 Tax=Curtobacterium sp. 314Chir4.1 TaxID=1279028 RepID=UPI000BD32DF0|nr:hypothetical protein [Curtobacterium sp. 314Chir4.1]SOC88542.1 hypothetical protein SAMN05660766_2249 [Curtobacterium sp. 314Chir4.1]